MRDAVSKNWASNAFEGDARSSIASGGSMRRIVIVFGLISSLTACDKLKKDDSTVQVSPSGVTAPGVTVTPSGVIAPGVTVTPSGVAAPAVTVTPTAGVTAGGRGGAGSPQGKGAVCTGGNCTCSGGGCTQTCPAGQACNFTCSGGNCTQTCQAGAASCNLTCSGGGCKQSCAMTCMKTCSGNGCT